MNSEVKYRAYCPSCGKNMIVQLKQHPEARRNLAMPGHSCVGKGRTPTSAVKEVTHLDTSGNPVGDPRIYTLK